MSRTLKDEETSGAFPSLRLAAAWLAIVLPLGAAAAIYLAARPAWTIAILFLRAEDIFPLVAASLILLLICLPPVRLGPALVARLASAARRRGWPIAAAAAAVVGVAALVGWFTIYQRHPLAMDEFWVGFDAAIFRRGRLLAELPARWRAFAPALQPAWPLVTPGGQFWASRYLPVNAALRALFGAVGSPALSGPFWAALSIAALYSLGRRLWPGRPDAALVAPLLLATSPQLLITAMSPYAMSAHLALNLVWLWLFLRQSPWSQGLAVAAAFAATGLHQLIFHPLFAAPFVASLWLERRWRAALFHTVAYGLICAFWLAWWTIAMNAVGVAPAAAGRLGAGWTVQIAAQLVAWPNFAGLGLMALNLLRFVAWQNPLAVALGALGAVQAVRARDKVGLPLAAGLILTIAVMAVIMPFQGHGWGYRYLHGLLGSLCLLAGLAWVRLTPTADGLQASDHAGLPPETFSHGEKERPAPLSAREDEGVRGRRLSPSPSLPLRGQAPRWRPNGRGVSWEARETRERRSPREKGGDNNAEGAGRAWAAFAVACAFCLVFALPLRAVQVIDLIRPYARSQGAIEVAAADVVVVDPAGLEYGDALVRNDPFLEGRPKVMNIDDLTVYGARSLCAAYHVALFDAAAGRAFGLPRSPAPPKTAAQLAVRRALSCARTMDLPTLGPTRRPSLGSPRG